MFISWYSVKAMAAILPASFLNLTTTSIFVGTTSFVNTFVAQYYGAKKYEKIGEIVWQGLYFAIIGGILHLLLIPFASFIFSIFGHEKDVLSCEIVYFQILCLGAFSPIASACLSSFFSGRGKTNIVLFVSVLHTVLNLFLDISVWSIFLLIIGKLGVIPLSSSNIAFNINTVAFMPMFGIGTGVSILVGQYIGKGKPEVGEKITYIGFLITFIYMCSIALTYVVFPDFYIKFFKPRVYTEDFENVRNLTVILLKFVAFYSVFDTMNVIFLSGLRGAGDTKFIMKVFFFTSIFVFLIPLYICTFIFNFGIFVNWAIATLYVIVIGFIFFIRFFKGDWKKLKLIETPSLL